MKPVIMFVTEWCPYCKKALGWMENIKKQNPEYADIEIKIIDEELEPDIAKQYTYYYVPTYYVDGIKVHEGVASKNIVNNIFEKAFK
ncbi:thioredoxin family protein [Clostridium estertheticum]|uniref:thioredoxin family protein n=1 Tax=Clostridium estertheticum TaxID=238834 RepID=UPI001CF2B3BA|nr:thioredoxin family protein [Clostridium estertheticum]MCB2354066.1 thioredoxin family protein [Clostridium estertheticum]WAG43200.1 thioredoxin family protein [Clostridium estertheticum]